MSRLRRILAALATVLGVALGLMLLLYRWLFPASTQAYLDEVGQLVERMDELAYGFDDAIFDEEGVTVDELLAYRDGWADICVGVSGLNTVVPGRFEQFHGHLLAYCSAKIQALNLWIEYEEDPTAVSQEELDSAFARAGNEWDAADEELRRLGVTIP